MFPSAMMCWIDLTIRDTTFLISVLALHVESAADPDTSMMKMRSARTSKQRVVGVVVVGVVDTVVLKVVLVRVLVGVTVAVVVAVVMNVVVGDVLVRHTSCPHRMSFATRAHASAWPPASLLSSAESTDKVVLRRLGKEVRLVRNTLDYCALKPSIPNHQRRDPI